MQFAELTFAGQTIYLADTEPRDQGLALLADGSFEAPLPLIFMALVKRSKGCVIDVGANTGIYSLLALKSRDDVHVHAFEPYLPLAEICRQNIGKNCADDRITLHRVALSDCKGNSKLYIPERTAGLLETSASLEPNFSNRPTTAVEVSTTTLDSFAFADISVIKVDIEGHEPVFLRGAEETIRLQRPIIFVEVLSIADLKSLNEFKRQFGYLDIRLRPTAAIADDVVRFDDSAWNHAFVPREKLPLMAKCFKAHGLPLTKYQPRRPRLLTKNLLSAAGYCYSRLGPALRQLMSKFQR
jgi:FkbM family methyltransferase